MSGRKGGWNRQSWQDAEAEIGKAVGLTVQTGDQVLQVPDELLEDSPYQARADYDDALITDLARGMAETGFQGVLFARTRPNAPRAGQAHYQLIFGHRRRRAWRLVCTERGAPCVLPVILRELSDQQLLTVGAQENLQREDLTPLEEAQLVIWHQQLYYPAGLGEIGRLLGKSEDWAKTRARVAQLPEPLKAVIRRSPQLMTGVLEVSRLYEGDPEGAVALAEHAEREGLNLRQIRALVA
jgi:ParB family chromosome partitioning protein